MRFVFQVARVGVLPCGWFFIHGGDTAGGRRASGMVLSCCRPRGTSAGKNTEVAIRQETSSPEATSPQERMLKMKLKIHQRTLAAWKGDLKMFNGLPEWVGVRTGRWFLLAAKSYAKTVQPLAQFAPQPIEGFQGKGQPQLFDRSLERKTRQQFYQPGPHQRSRQRVARQNLCQTE